MSFVIQQFLELLIKYDGDKVILNTIEPPYIIKNNQKMSVSKQVLTSNDFKAIENEFALIFKNKDIFAFKGKTIRVIKKEAYLEFAVDIPKPTIVQNNYESMQAEEKTNIQYATASSSDISVGSNRFDINDILKAMFTKRASDLHLTSKLKPIMRIDGDMVILDEYPVLEEKWLFEELKKIAPPYSIKEFEETNDTDFAYEIENVARYRGNIFRDNKGVCAVFRLIPSKIIPASVLNIPQPVLDLCNIPKGLILVTGPTGSGKSTTLAAMIDYINENQRAHIITIEDPIEFVHPTKKALINQREIVAHTESFKRALKAALREDPDVVLIGEMRDLETIAIAIETAITGHLVFGTLHTSTAIGTIDRIIDQFPADRQSQVRTMLADALRGVVAQALLKKKGGGRVAALEILVSTPAIANLIREGKNFQISTLMQTGKALGMRLMNDCLFELVEKNIVEPEEAIDKAIDKDGLIKALTAKGLYKKPN